MSRVFLLLSSLIVLCCCATKQSSEVNSYAVISHTRLNDNSGIDSLVGYADLSKYELLLLGGDMANLSSCDDSIMKYLDSRFDVSNPKTLWALGNHDYTSVELLKSYTKKETYYAYCQDKTVFIVLDTQKDSSRIKDSQLEFFNSVMDTVTDSKNIVLLTHKLIWMRGEPRLESQINSVSNGEFGDCSYCVQENNYYQDIYPKLVEFRENKGQVFCVAGDIGFNEKKFEYLSDDGIQFLASGLKANTKGNFFLELSNDLTDFSLTYQFKELSGL